MQPAPWQALLDWWFGPCADAVAMAAERQRLWFGKRPEQDDEARKRFGTLMDEALAGGLDDWVAMPQGWLALILLLDQLPRMVHRGTPAAFAGDERALHLVREGLAQGGDVLLAPIQRAFVYLVFEHAENLAMQEQAVTHFTVLRDITQAEERALFESFLDFAVRHRDVIARFGRFPHRNAILGRTSDEAESAFLEQPGSRF